MSSTGQCSYRSGRILDGAVSGLARFGIAEGLCEEEVLEHPGTWEIRLLDGEGDGGAEWAHCA